MKSKHNIRKLISIIVAVAVLFGVSGCGGFDRASKIYVVDVINSEEIFELKINCTQANMSHYIAFRCDETLDELKTKFAKQVDRATIEDGVLLLDVEKPDARRYYIRERKKQTEGDVDDFMLSTCFAQIRSEQVGSITTSFPTYLLEAFNSTELSDKWINFASSQEEVVAYYKKYTKFTIAESENKITVTHDEQSFEVEFDDSQIRFIVHEK